MGKWFRSREKVVSKKEEKRMPDETPVPDRDLIREIKTNYFIEKTQGGGKGIGHLEDKDREQEIKRGKANVGWGNKIHVNHSPFDKDGKEIGPGDPRWADVPKIDDMYVYTTWELDGNPQDDRVDLGSYADNYGCTPTLKVNKKHEDSREHVLTFRGHYGKSVKGPEQRVRIS